MGAAIYEGRVGMGEGVSICDVKPRGYAPT